ncbi:aldo/keto reductase [Muribaculum intestinale]|uniref:aldo/keto reductase n=1 Tax=Muribaculum intestinale TaxID=1796646 RepID=UPI0025AE3DA3|nr:aldo/keto reductase [Muribaculum intestinale]
MNNFRTISGLAVSSVGLGCMGMSHAYGAPADKKAMKTLLADAVEMGYTLFDTAEIYGTDTNPHENEELLGEALKPYRDRVVITTKFGLTFDKSHEPGPYPLIPDSTPDSIRKAVDGSLRRLQTDHIDLYLQHRIDPDVEPEIVADTMSQLIQEGKILHWGISETTEEYLRHAHAICPVTAIQNRYSMMARWHEDIFPTLEELNVGFIAFSPLANGLLSDFYTADSKFNPKNDYRAAMPQFSRESFDENEMLFELIRRLADEKHATPSQISLAWMLCKKPYIVPIPGTRHLCRLKENIGAADISLSIKEVEAIDSKLDSMPMSSVFGGSKIIRTQKV